MTIILVTTHQTIRKLMPNILLHAIWHLTALIKCVFQNKESSAILHDHKIYNTAWEKKKTLHNSSLCWILRHKLGLSVCTNKWGMAWCSGSRWANSITQSEFSTKVDRNVRDRLEHTPTKKFLFSHAFYALPTPSHPTPNKPLLKC